jgi:hypothetical protein
VNVRTSLGRLPAGLAAVVLMAGCAANTSPTPVPATPGVAPTAGAPVVKPTIAATLSSPAAPAAATALPPPVTYDDATVVAGTDACTIDLGTGTAGPDGATQSRDGRLTCTANVNDPRVSGTERGSWNLDWWGPASGPGAGVQWGTIRLENAGGAWEGKATGIRSTDRGDIIAAWYTGSGGYAGLSYFELITGTGPWTIQGQIQPGDPPTPSIAQVVEDVTPPPAESVAPLPVPTPVVYDPVTLVEGSERSAGSWGDFGLRSTDANDVQHWRGTSAWLHETNDPRVTGTDVTDLNMDGWEQPWHGAAIQWGSARLTNPEGSWTGTSSGVFDSVHGDAFVAWFTGGGAYAGLTYFVLGTGAGGGAIKLQGLIYPGTPPAP